MKSSSYLRDHLASIGIAVPQYRSSQFVQSPNGPAGVVNSRPGSHGRLVPPNVSVQNQANQYGAFPWLYDGAGYRYFPPYGNQPFTRYVGKDVYVQALYILGYGEFEISEYWLGNRKLNLTWDGNVGTDDKQDQFVQVEVLFGAPSDGPLTTFPSIAVEDASSNTLTNAWQTRETPIACDEILLTFNFPNGLYQNDANGKPTPYDVELQVEYAETDGSGAVLGAGWISAGVIDTRFASTGAIRRGATIETSTRSLYLVRVKRAVAQSTNADVSDEVDWQTLTAIVNEDPVPTRYNLDGSVLPIAKIAVKAQVTDKRNQTLDNFSITAKRKIQVYDGSSWSSATSSNPAWALVDIYTGSLNKNPITKDRFDLVKIKAWADSCEAAGLQFRQVLDQQVQCSQQATDICTAGRASFVQQNGKYSVFHDAKNDIITQVFSPLNTSGFKFTASYLYYPHALRVNFINPDIFFQQDEIIVYADGYNEDGSGGKARARLFDRYQLSGVASATQAYKLGRYYLACGVLRPYTINFSADIEHLLCNVGDRIKVAHDVLMNSQGQAYLSGINTDDDGNCLSVNLEAPIILIAATEYTVAIRSGNNVLITKTIQNVPGEQWTLEFVDPIPFGDPQPTAGDLLVIDPESTFTITQIDHQSSPHLSAQITAVPYDERIFAADTEDIGVFQSKITLAFSELNRDVAAPHVLNIQSDASVSTEGTDGSHIPRILISLAKPDARVVDFVARYKYVVEDSGSDWEVFAPFDASSGSVSIQPVQAGYSYDIAIKAVTALGVESEWTTISGHTVAGDTSIPPDVATCDLVNGNLRWFSPSIPSNFAGYEVRSIASPDDNWDLGTPVVTGLVPINQLDVSSFPGGTRTYMIKMKNTSGAYSLNACFLSVDLGDPLTNNVVVGTSEAPTFSGSKSGCSVVSSVLKASSLTLMWQTDDGVKQWNANPATPEWTSNFSPMVYQWQYTVASTAVPGNLQVLIAFANVANASGWVLEYRKDTTTVAFWSGTDSDPMWGPSDSAAFWNAGNFNDWQTFPGQLAAEAAVYQFRLTVPGGSNQAVVNNITTQVDVPDVIEKINPMSVASGTGSRVPITKKFKVVTAVHFNEVNGSTGGRTYVIAEPGAYPTTIGAGPLIKIIDSSNAVVAGTVNVTVLGY